MWDYNDRSPLRWITRRFQRACRSFKSASGLSLLCKLILSHSGVISATTTTKTLKNAICSSSQLHDWRDTLPRSSHSTARAQLFITSRARALFWHGSVYHAGHEAPLCSSSLTLLQTSTRPVRGNGSVAKISANQSRSMSLVFMWEEI